jgi:nitrite reductase/ring-hydroxylating ferredoxin subunit
MSAAPHPLAPAPGTYLCDLAEVPDRGGREVAFGDGPEPFRIVLLRLGDEIFAYRNLCPHFSIPLNYEPARFITCEGELLMCAHHTSFFRIRDGRCLEGPAEGTGLEPIPVRRQGSRIHLGG